jgi:hypothetical protein
MYPEKGVVAMPKIKFALIGSGWRAEFYIRIAKALPDLFELTNVLIRDKEKGKVFAKAFQVDVVNTLDELLSRNPDFVVLSVKRGITKNYLMQLFRIGIPVLSETPPAETEEELLSLWDTAKKYHAKVQVAEQYFTQPLYAAWQEAIQSGLIGTGENMDLSALHGYHGVSMIRRMLGIGFQNCTIFGKRYHFPVTETYGREGMCFDGEVFSCPRDRFTFEFDGGKTAFFDFSDPAQYHSFIRTRRLNVQGVRGEINDLTVRYLSDKNIPVKQDLNRIDLGVYGNQEWSHFGIMLGERFLYRSPFPNARLNDDEIAVATLLAEMKHCLETGKDVYSLADALQDIYLCLKMEEAAACPLQPIVTATQPWAEVS